MRTRASDKPAREREREKDTQRERGSEATGYECIIGLNYCRQEKNVMENNYRDKAEKLVASPGGHLAIGLTNKPLAAAVCL